MQRVDNDPTDLFENGNPATGIEGTRLMAEWLNSMQEEVCFVIEEAGLTLDTGDDTQLHEALGIDFNDIPSGEKILFYKNTAVVGYSLLDTLDDKVVYVTKGSAAGGQTGGTVHSSGSWTISGLAADSHALTLPEIPAHGHSTPAYNDTQTGLSGFLRRSTNYSGVVPTSSVGGGAGHEHSITHTPAWRQAAYCCTMQQRS